MDPPKASDPGWQPGHPRGKQHGEAYPTRSGNGNPAGDLPEQREVRQRLRSGAALLQSSDVSRDGSVCCWSRAAFTFSSVQTRGDSHQGTGTSLTGFNDVLLFFIISVPDSPHEPEPEPYEPMPPRLIPLDEVSMRSVSLLCCSQSCLHVKLIPAQPLNRHISRGQGGGGLWWLWSVEHWSTPLQRLGNC